MIFNNAAGLTVGEWTAVIGVATTIVCSIVIPLFKFFEKRKRQYEETVNKVRAIETEVTRLSNQIDEMMTVCSNLTEIQSRMTETYDSLMTQIDRFETQQLKHVINDAFLGYDCIEDIPDEILIGASQSCDIYIGKGLNHETGSRCHLIFQELERRQAIRAHSRGGDDHE